MKNFKHLHLALLALLVPALAAGHARLLPGGPVNVRSTNPGIKAGPCGGFGRVTPTVLQPGQQVVIRWEETIDHPGFYRIAWSPANDQGFDTNILATNLADVQGGALPHQYQATVTIPTTPCPTCTIQLIQYMTETNPPQLYYSCADVQTTAGPAPVPTPTGGPGCN